MSAEFCFYGVKYLTISKIGRDNKRLQTLTVYSDFRTGQFLLCKYHGKSLKADVNCLSGSTSSATHDPRKNIAPSFSFGIRHKEFTNNHSPGPKLNIESSLTRHGRSGAPQVTRFIDFICWFSKYSMYSRSKSATAFNTPGPGTYRNENVRASHKAAPAYSLTGRAKSGYSNKTPGRLWTIWAYRNGFKDLPPICCPARVWTDMERPHIRCGSSQQLAHLLKIWPRQLSEIKEDN